MKESKKNIMNKLEALEQKRWDEARACYESCNAVLFDDDGEITIDELPVEYDALEERWMAARKVLDNFLYMYLFL